MTTAYLHPASVGGRAYLAPLTAPAATSKVSNDLSIAYTVLAAGALAHVTADLPIAYAVRGGVAFDFGVSYSVLATGTPPGPLIATVRFIPLSSLRRRST